MAASLNCAVFPKRAASALQSRGGDGFFLSAPTRPGPTNRLPEHEVCGESGLRKLRRRVWVNEKSCRRLATRQHGDARPPVGTHLYPERRLKNLFEQFALINRGRRANAEAAAVLHQNHLVRVFGGEI